MGAHSRCQCISFIYQGINLPLLYVSVHCPIVRKLATGLGMPWKNYAERRVFQRCSHLEPSDAAYRHVHLPWRFPCGHLRTELPLRRLQLPAHHPQTGERKQRKYQSGVPGQGPGSAPWCSRNAACSLGRMINLRSNTDAAALRAPPLSVLARVANGLDLRTLGGNDKVALQSNGSVRLSALV